MPQSIELEGICTHNLKNISISIPQGSLTAVSGVSGSGKSSLVFHTLHAQSYRRYVDSLSSYARQFLKSFPKPEVETTAHLLPSIAVRQSGGGLGPRSTVGSLTEIHDLLRNIFAAEASCVSPHAPHDELPWYEEQDIARHIRESFRGCASSSADHIYALICAPLEPLLTSSQADKSDGITQAAASKPAKKIGATQQDPALNAILAMLKEQGLVRLRDARGKLHRLDQEMDGSAAEMRSWQVVMDRVDLTAEDAHDRLIEALQKCFTFAPEGAVEVAYSGGSKGQGQGPVQRYRRGFYCTASGFHAPKPRAEFFQATHPKGACPTCQGYGQMMIWNWDKILSHCSDDEPSLASNLGLYKAAGGRAFAEHLRAHAEKRGLSLSKPFAEYEEEEKSWLKWGEGPHDDRVEGQLLPDTQDIFYGLRGFLLDLSKRQSRNLRFQLARYRSYRVCSDCNGQKLCSLSLSYHLGGLNFAAVQLLSVTHLLQWLEEVQQRSTHGSMLQEAFGECKERLGYLQQIGLDYLSMGRAARSLSGGELQRIHMARCLGSALTRTLYCLDEPTAGLHPLDTRRLLGVMQKLRDQGNTVVVVEHDPNTLMGCDHLLRIGPGAGHKGGELCYAGPPQKCTELQKNPQRWQISAATRQTFSSKLTLKEVRTHNLEVSEVDFPLGAIIGVCGVSGSGKTSLIRHSLYPALCEQLGQEQKHDTPAANYGELQGDVSDLCDVLLVSQEALGRSSRANIATYLGIFTELRKILADTPTAQQLRLTQSSFSFNSPGGRCETCLGLGTVTEDLSFLGVISVPCPTCRGKRFLPEVLKVSYRGKNVHEILNLTVSEARSFFEGLPLITRILDEVLDLGLGYLTLAQSTRSFSGGEAQRLKILRLLIHKDHNGRGKQVLIFDEPTGGLAEEDVLFLWRKFQKLKRAGHTLVVVEHHLGLLQSVDWLIEIGPGSADRGGKLVYQGVPEDILQSSASTLAPFLQQ